MSSKVKGFLSAMGVGAVFVAVTVTANWSSGNYMRLFCDGLTMAAAMLLCYAGLVFSRNEGTFDMITFGLNKAMNIRYRNKRTEETFSDYRKRKKKERKPVGGSLWAGLVYLALALILILIYYILR